ncbi:MAG TPA: RDD family protein [Thermoanaerobaculia bacterium]|nr:RDD family protein [Thermoanaerobaculia bacterium]
MSSARFYFECGQDRFALLPGTSTIGRSRNCEVLLDDPSASRNHALVTLDNERVILQDLGSANGTLVNGRRLEGEIEIQHGDVVTVGETRLVLKAVASQAATQLMDLESIAAVSEGTSRPMSPSEAISALEAMPVGEVIARPAPYRDATDIHPPSAFGEPEPPPPPPLPFPSEPGEVLPSFEEIDRRLSEGGAVLTQTGSYEVSRIDLPAAGFWRRVGAMLVDGLLVGALSLLSSFALGGPSSGGGVLVAMVVSLVASVVLPVVGWSRWGTTPGKRLLGLYVCTTDGQVGLPFGRALLRFVGYLVSALPLGIGYVMPLFTVRKRALHDLIAGTYVGYLARR